MCCLGHVTSTGHCFLRSVRPQPMRRPEPVHSIYGFRSQVGALVAIVCVAHVAAESKVTHVVTDNSTVPLEPAASRRAFVTIATDDYFALGALVALHSLSLHGDDLVGVDRVLMVPPAPGISARWRRRFVALGIRVVDVPLVQASTAVAAAMAADRRKLQTDGLLELLQPVPYGGAFAKIHAWDTTIFGNYSRVALIDGDIVAKRSAAGLLDLEPLSAAKDLNDAFNYGVVVLQPDALVHAALLRLLSNASSEQIAKYNTRGTNNAGFCDQTLVAGYLAAHHGPVHFFEDLRASSRAKPWAWLLSTEWNLLVSYRSQDRCDSRKERRRVDHSRLVHFSNNWLHFGALAKDRDSSGRLDSPRCYRGAFHYWHDVYRHALVVARARGPWPTTPQYVPIERQPREALAEVDRARVQRVAESFARLRRRAEEDADPEDAHEEVNVAGAEGRREL